jgi:hypothetical protein
VQAARLGNNQAAFFGREKKQQEEDGQAVRLANRFPQQVYSTIVFRERMPASVATNGIK